MVWGIRQNMKRNSPALKRFVQDYLPLLVITLLVQTAFFSILFFIKGISLKETIYFSFLTLFVLVLYILLRFYSRGRVYKKLFLETDNINEYLIYNPRGSFERTYNQQIQHLIKLQREQSNKYEADKKLQKVLMYRFVHQMKTPISVMKLISENHHDDETFKIINQNLNTVQYHLDQMLHIYRLDDFKNDFVAEKVYLNAVCKDCINSLKDYFIVSQIYPKLDIPEETYVYSDSKWLKLIITQILTNAIKYSDADQPIRLVTEKNNDTVTLSITDYGMGIQDNELAKIFNLFYVGENGRNNADSSGIGLYIVKRIIEYLDHDVTIESKLNQGTTVFIKF